MSSPICTTKAWLVCALASALLITGCVLAPSPTEEQLTLTRGQTAGHRPGWPTHNQGPVNAIDLQGTTLAAPTGTETWLTPMPVKPLAEHVLVIDFWATWCAPCLAASPTLDKIQKQHEGDVLVLAFSGLAAGKRFPEDEATIRAFIEDHPVSYHHLHDPTVSVYKQVAPTGIPHAVVISTDGVVRWQGSPHDPRLPGIVDAVVRADPGLTPAPEQPASD